MKQLVFEPDSVIVPEGLKMQTNGFINGAAIVTTTTTLPSTNAQATITSNVCEDTKPSLLGNENFEDVKPSPQVLLGNENFVTLHIPEDESMVTNELDAFNQNEEISKLFKQVRNLNRSLCSKYGVAYSKNFSFFRKLVLRRLSTMCWIC